MTKSDRDLKAEVTAFTERLVDTCSTVLGESVEFAVNVGPAGATNQHITINQADALGIALKVDGDIVFRMVVSYKCGWHPDQHFFAVEGSSFIIRIEDVNEPILHFDYVRNAGNTVPVSHINVHAHRDELVFALMKASSGRGKARARASGAGKILRISTLHIPQGGHRFRPSIEDVFEMMIQEFGIDRSADALDAIQNGRSEFRSIQVSAAVSDDPAAAARALERLGYKVRAPTPAALPRVDRLTRY